MSRPTPYGIDLQEPSVTEEHSHTQEEVVLVGELPNHVTCHTLVAQDSVTADDYLSAPEVRVGGMVITTGATGGEIQVVNLAATTVSSAIITATTMLTVAGVAVVPSVYAHKTDVADDIAEALTGYTVFEHISEPVGHPQQVVIDENLVVPSIDIGLAALRYEDGQLTVDKTVNVSSLQIDGVAFDMDGHSSVMDQHAEFFQDVEVTGDPGDEATRV